MKLIMVRHGESAHNTCDLVQGHVSSKLTEKGIVQANSAAEFLRNEKIDSIYSSDLDRAKETAEIINKHHKKAIEFLEVLRERSFGEFENKPFEEFHKAVNESGEKYHQYKPQEGESCEEKGQEMMDFIFKIAKKNKNKTVLIVTHGGNILEVLVRSLNIAREDYKDYNPENCAVTILNIKNNEKITSDVINECPWRGVGK